MPFRFAATAAALLFFAFSAMAQDQADVRKQFFASLAAIEKTARERPLQAAEWEQLARVEETAAEMIRQAEKKQEELDRSGKSELYRLFVRTSRLEAATKAKTITPAELAEKSRIQEEIARLAEPLLTARLKELAARKEANDELSLRETAILDGLTRWRATVDDVTASVQHNDAALEMNAPRMDLQQLIWIEQISIMEAQGAARRDLRLKDQLSEIHRWIQRRAEAQDADARDVTLKRLSELRAKRAN